MSAAVVIVNWNSADRLRRCIESLLATTPDAEVIVVDNASTDGSLEQIAGFRNDIDVVQNSVNRGFAAAVNQGFAQTSAPFVLILNPDIRVLPGSVQILSEFLNTHPKASAVGGYVNEKYLPRDLPSVASLVRENLGIGIKQRVLTNESAIRVEQPAAAALMVRRDAYDEIGGFDERFFPAWYEDVDFCQRMKDAGWEIYFAPDAQFQHEGGYSADALGAKGFAEAYYGNQMRYADKHFGIVGRLAVRGSIALGMVLRIAAKPGNASAYTSVLMSVFRTRSKDAKR